MRRTTQNGTTTIGRLGTRKTAGSDHSKTFIGRSLTFNITILTQLHVVDWAGKGKLRKKNTTDRATDTVPPQQTQFTTFHLDSFIIILMHRTILSLTTTIRTPHPRNPYSDTISLIRLLCCCYHHHRMYNN